MVWYGNVQQISLKNIIYLSHIKCNSPTFPGDPAVEPRDPAVRPRYPAVGPWNPANTPRDPAAKLWYPMNTPRYHDRLWCRTYTSYIYIFKFDILPTYSPLKACNINLTRWKNYKWFLNMGAETSTHMWLSAQLAFHVVNVCPNIEHKFFFENT